MSTQRMRVQLSAHKSFALTHVASSLLREQGLMLPTRPEGSVSVYAALGVLKNAGAKK